MKTIARTVMLTTALLLAGCQETPEQRTARQKRDADAAMMSEATWRLRQAARNPGSIETRNVRIGARSYSGMKAVCGEFNGENGFGGMSGFERFIMLDGKIPLLATRSAERQIFELAWQEAGC